MGRESSGLFRKRQETDATPAAGVLRSRESATLSRSIRLACPLANRTCFSRPPHAPLPPLRPRVEGIEQMGIGPVQYMVVAFPGNKFKGKSPPRSKSS